jgi:uncharacterized membrane protein
MLKYIGMSLIILSCGSGETKYVQAPGQAPGGQVPGGQTPGGKTSFADAQTIMSSYCTACHANSPWVQSERGLRSSSVKGRVANRSMPPLNGPQMPEEARQRLLNFF